MDELILSYRPNEEVFAAVDSIVATVSSTTSNPAPLAGNPTEDQEPMDQSEQVGSSKKSDSPNDNRLIIIETQNESVDDHNSVTENSNESGNEDPTTMEVQVIPRFRHYDWVIKDPTKKAHKKIRKMPMDKLEKLFELTKELAEQFPDEPKLMERMIMLQAAIQTRKENGRTSIGPRTPPLQADLSEYTIPKRTNLRMSQWRLATIAKLTTIVRPTIIVRQTTMSKPTILSRRATNGLPLPEAKRREEEPATISRTGPTHRRRASLHQTVPSL